MHMEHGTLSDAALSQTGIPSTSKAVGERPNDLLPKDDLAVCHKSLYLCYLTHVLLHVAEILYYCLLNALTSFIYLKTLLASIV